MKPIEEIVEEFDNEFGQYFYKNGKNWVRQHVKNNLTQTLQKERDEADRRVAEEREKIIEIVQDESNRGSMFGDSFKDVIYRIQALNK